jgi:integrase
VFWNHETETRFVSIKKAWSTTFEKAQITGFRFHDLRHTFASFVQMGLQGAEESVAAHRATSR